MVLIMKILITIPEAKMECRNFAVLVFIIVISSNVGKATLNFSSIHDIFNISVISYNLSQLFNNLEMKINSTYRFLRYNWMLDPVCAEEFDECNTTLSCCNEDLVCFQIVENSSHRCTNISWINDTLGEDLDNHVNRLNDLTYDINYRDWANSFEFESRSAMRREEDKAREEEAWKEKHKHEVQEENKWLPMLKRLVEKSKRKWREIQKLKKLKEVKNIIQEKISSRKHEDSLPSNEEIMTEPEIKQEESIKPSKIDKPKHIKHEHKNDVKPKKEDSKELRKKKYPGLDQLLQDADDVVKKHKAKEVEKYSSEERTSSEKQRSNEIAQIEDTEDKLEEELKRLKALKKQESDKKETEALDDTKREEIKELIKKQVALILEQERKLSGLMKLNELKKMQENIKAQAGGNIQQQNIEQEVNNI